jgi:hypothetical protein
MPDLFEWSALKAIYRSLGIALIAFFLADCWMVWRYFEAMHGSDDLAEYANGLAIGLGLLLTLVIAQQHPAGSWRRSFWYLSSVLLLVIGCNEVFDVGERIDRAWADDDYMDLVVLALTPVGLYLVCLIESAPRIAVQSMRFGFAFQCLSAIIDLGDGDLYQVTLYGAGMMNVLADISELIFIETYVFGLGCLLLHMVTRRLSDQRRPG